MLDRIEHYFRADALSQSYLKKLIGLKEEDDTIVKYKFNRSMDEGSIIDDIISLGEEFTEKYTIIKDDPNLDKLWKYPLVLQDLSIDQYNYEDRKEEILIAIKPLDNRLKPENHWKNVEDIIYVTQYDKFIQEGYYQECVGHSWRILSSPDFEEFQDCYKQIPLFGEYKDLSLKGLLDFSGDRVIADLKCTRALSFDYIAKRLRYDFQMAFYRYLKSQINQIDEEYITCYWLVYNLNWKRLQKIRIDPMDLEIGKNGAYTYTTLYSSFGNRLTTLKNETLGFTQVLDNLIAAKQEELEYWEYTKKLKPTSIYVK